MDGPVAANLGSHVTDLARMLAKGAMAPALAATTLALGSLPALGEPSSALAQCINAKSADERISACSGAIAAERGSGAAIAYNFRAVARHDKHDLDSALADFDQAVRLDPNYANAFNNRGIAWQAKGNLDRAIADHSEAIRLDPKEKAGARARSAL